MKIWFAYIVQGDNKKKTREHVVDNINNKNISKKIKKRSL